MISTNKFINTMTKDVQACKEFAEQHWLVASPEARSWIDPYFGWCIDYIMQHLAAFPTLYLPVIEQEINAALAKKINPQPTYHFTPELTDLFNRLSYEGLETMMEAGHFSQIDVEIAEGYEAEQVDFITIQEHLIRLLEMAKQVDLEKIIIPSIIFPNIDFKLGDCFQFLIRHQILHFAQAEIIMNAYTESISQRA